MVISTNKQNKQSNRLLTIHRVAGIKWRVFNFKNTTVTVGSLVLASAKMPRSSLDGSVPSSDQRLYSGGEKYGEMLGLKNSTGINRHFQKGIMKEKPGLNLI